MTRDIDTAVPFTSPFPQATPEAWRAAVDAVLKGKPFERTLVGRTADGIAIQPLYPARRDSQPLAGRAPGTPWVIAQRIDHPVPTEANAQALEDLSQGASGLVLVTHGAIGDRRGDGATVEQLADLATILDGVMLDIISLRVDAGTGGGHVAAMLTALVEARKLDPASLDIAFGIDPISAFARRGTLEDWTTAAQKAADVALGLAARGFRSPALMADARVVHDAGGSEAQELAFAIGSGLDLMRALERAGMSLDDARRQIAFTLAVDADQFLGLAKCRALRRLWSRIETACGLEPRPIALHAETAWRMTTAVDPAVNWLRTTVACFAAGVGGANAVAVQPWTAAIGLPDAFARRIARNTQLILIEESNLHRLTDPAAGAGGMEALTDDLCAAAWALFQADEADGGLVAALGKGKPQARILACAETRRRDVATRKVPLTGASEFPQVDEVRPDVLAVTRPAKPQAAPPLDLPKAGTGARFDAMVAAFAGGATRGQLSRAKTDRIFVTGLAPRRLAEPFETIRSTLDAETARTGTRPKVFIATLGSIAAFTPRATFARAFFEAGGFAAPFGDGFADHAALVAAFRASGATRAVLASSDEIYAADAEAAARALKAAGCRRLWLAGRPGEAEAALRAAGVDEFIFVGVDMIDSLTRAVEHP